jgi:hypothetical protein
MNIVFLIGNGFDINLGMKTSYADFYDDLVKTYIVGPGSIENLHQSIEKYKKTNLWADLEKGLGEYTKEISNVRELREVYFHLNDALKNYLANQKLNGRYLTAEAASKLKKDLMNPHNCFLPRFRQAIQDYMNPSRVVQDEVSIITFNYTDTIEKILGVGGYKLPLELGVKNTNGDKRMLNSIYHIHGTLNDSELIMGVNDLSQIKNDNLAKDPSAQSMLVKPETTLNRGDLLDDKCERLMRNSDLFCLFGISIGETDNKWWDMLAARMNSSNAHIIYYGHTTKKVEHNQDLWDIQRGFRDMLVEKFVRKPLDKASSLARIHVVVNSNMFKL